MTATSQDAGRVDGLVTSLDNPTIRFARQLQRRRFRYRERSVLVEGVRAIRTAVEHGAVVQTLLLDERQAAALAPDSPIRVAARRVLTVGGQAFESVADTEHPQPLIAICDMPDWSIPAASSLVLALDGVRDPGNLGTLIRTAAAAGVDAVALLPECVDQFNPKSIRASSGCVFAVPVVRMSGLPTVFSELAVKPIVVLADADGTQRWDDYDWTQPTLLLIGGEAEGVSETSRTYADVVLSLPMRPGVESLNVAAAGAALLYEGVRQRRVER